MNTPFCNGTIFKIDNEKLKEKVFKESETILGFTLKRDYFPGPQPVAVMLKDFEKLKKDYMVCEKSDGERYVMLLLNIDNKPMCFLINRNNDLYFVTLSLKKEVFEGSIFDGEIIKTKNELNWHYLVHDCYAYNGKSFMEISHDLRYASILDFITKRYVPKETDCFNIKTKIFYKYGAELDKTWDHITKTTENNIDGLIFTPINEPVKFGRDNNLLKWKEPGSHTIDFFVKKVGKKINLYGTRKGTNYIFKSLVESDQSYKNIVSFEDTDLKSGTIIEFNYNLKEDIFKPYRLRLDKHNPNGEITINNTLKNIEESILIDHFVKSF